MKRKVFTKEFKLEAVRLLESSGRAAAEVARELGLRVAHLFFHDQFRQFLFQRVKFRARAVAASRCARRAS